MFSTVYFRFQNYWNTSIVFVFENIVLLSVPMKKKYESKNGGVFRRSFPTVFISKRIPKCSSFLILRMCQESWYCSSCLAQVKPNVAKVTCFYKASWFSFQRSHVVEQTFCSPNACSLVMSAAGNSRAPTVVADPALCMNKFELARVCLVQGSRKCWALDH